MPIADEAARLAALHVSLAAKLDDVVAAYGPPATATERRVLKALHEQAKAYSEIAGTIERASIDGEAHLSRPLAEVHVAESEAGVELARWRDHWALRASLRPNGAASNKNGGGSQASC